MPGKSIFIASSYEARGLAKRIAEYLGQTGDVLPVPWWDAFVLGGYTFDELNRQSRSVDAAIFIATKDDKVWYRQIKTDRPRDNVIFEYGLFANRLGRYRSIMVVEKGVKLPSDVLGVTYQPLDRKNVETTAKKLVAHFAKEFQEDRINDARSSLRVICHPELPSLQISNTLPAGWLMRGMYLGTDGARAWLKNAVDRDYQSDLERAELSNKITNMLNRDATAFRTYVSLGPGDAELDNAVALALLEREPTAQCIPVDLSDGLLWFAVLSLSDRIRIPIGLLADFEENFKFVSRQVREYAKGPYLYGLFGNTFGNLDKVETLFLSQLKLYLERDDKFMLDVTTVKDGTSSKVGPVDTSGWPGGLKWFFAHGATRYLNVSMTEAFNRFDELTKVTLTEYDSPIPGTQLLTVSAGNTVFARVRRYRFDKLKQFFQANGFKVDSDSVECEGAFNIGLLVLQRKND
jgi:hypothetical protein